MVDRLEADRHEVLAIDDLSTEREVNLSAAMKSGLVRLEVCDI